jgi:hypothetical protein
MTDSRSVSRTRKEGLMSKSRTGILPVALVVACLPMQWAPGADVLIEVGETWKYFKGTSEASTPVDAWRQIDFDDTVAGWLEGPTGIGYGDNDDATVLDDMLDGYETVFCRKAFNVANPAAFTNLKLSVDFDDGFKAYLNGTEVYRYNCDNPNFDNSATGGREAGEALIVDISSFLPNLVAGKNVLAVEVKNDNIDSTDLSFIPRLTANDDTLACPIGFACAASGNSVTLTWTNLSAVYDAIDIRRNGVRIAGSPFAGSTTTATDADPGQFDVVYEMIASAGADSCAARTCTVTAGARGLGDCTCSLALVEVPGSGFFTQGTVTWTNIPSTVQAEVIREGAVLATLIGGEETYTDPNVESDQPEDDTTFQVRLTDSSGNVATLNCGTDITLCPTVTCSTVTEGGSPHAQITFGNLVKEWATFTILRTDDTGTAVTVTDTLSGTATEFVDIDFIPELGAVYTYTLSPVAPAGEQVGCDRTCTYILPLIENAEYDPPTGGWDYVIDFEAHPGTNMLIYNPTTGQTGNLDGEWIRSVDRDFWDGSAPLEVGAAPDGPAPGGIEIVSRPGLGPCGKGIKALRILDPGNPSAPGTSSLATEYPDAFTDPSNKSIFLGFDTGITDRNLLRTGVTLYARWRIPPDAPAYMQAGTSGDGTGLVGDALGSIGLHFLNTNNVLATEVGSKSASFALNSGDVLLFSAAPVVQYTNAFNNTFRSIWVTVMDPEADGTYDINVYTNGRITPFSFGTGTGIALSDEPFSFGAEVGNYLAIGIPDEGGDAVVEIDAIAYKIGVHAPQATSCSGGPNVQPTARITVVPPSGSVQLVGGTAQITLNGSTSDDGDGGSQGLSFRWTRTSGPAAATIASPTASATTVTFTAAGSYVFQLQVDDGQSTSNTDTAQVTISVTGGGTKPKFRRGDVDGNGKLELTDPIISLTFQYMGGAPPECMDAADADDSGSVDLSDPIYSLTFQYMGGPPPLPPYPDCGEDSTPTGKWDSNACVYNPNPPNACQ